MAIYRVKDGELKDIMESGVRGTLDRTWIAEHLANRSALLPELFVIGEFDSPDPGGLIALDEEGSIVVILISDRSPGETAIGETAELAWDLRHAGYGELERRARDYLKGQGIAASALDELHAGFFGLVRPLAGGMFNHDQRLVVVAPEFSDEAVNALSWRRLELDIEAYRIQPIAVDSGEAFVSSEPVEELAGNRLAGMVSLLSNTPSMLAKRALAQRPDADSSVTGARRGLLSSAVELLTRVDALPVAYAYAALAILIALYAGVFGFLSVRNHTNFSTFGFDLGIFDQGIWLLSQGAAPFVTVRGLHLFAEHYSPILLAIAPLYRIWADARLLLLLQTAALAVGALPVFLLARDRLKGNLLPVAFAASYLLYPALQWLNHDQFHPDAFAVPALLFAFYYAAGKRYVPFAIASTIALLATENAAPVVFMLGLYIALTGRRREGLVTVAASLAWLMLSLKYALPRFGGDASLYLQNFSRLGTTPGDILANLLTRPELALSVLAQQNKLDYLLGLLAPAAFLPLASVEIFVVALPALLANLLGQAYTDSIQYHFTALIIPFVFASSIMALERLRLDRRATAVVAGIVLIVALACNYLWSPSPISQNYADGAWPSAYERERVTNEALALIPGDAPVSAFYRMVPHLTHRTRIYEFPNPFRVANWGKSGENPPDPATIDYVAVDMNEVPNDQRLLVEKLRNKDFAQIFSKQGIVILKRR